MSTANPQQNDAINHLDGPLLIIAGPGSGKTFTLVERIINIIKKRSIKPENLLISTFTEKTAAELVTRISNKLAIENISFNINEMYIGTFHSICLKIIDEFRDLTRLKRNYRLLDDFEQKYFLLNNLKKITSLQNYESFRTNHIRAYSYWEQADIIIN